MNTGITTIEAVRDEHLSLIDRAGSIDVTDAASADVAGRVLTEVNAVLKSIDEARFSITRPLDEAKSKAMDQAKMAKAPYEEAKQALDGAILGWTIAERQRIAAENARAEAERVELEVAAQNAAERGEFEEAQEIQSRRDAAGTTEKVHRTAGTQARFTWVGEVTSLDDLILAVASGEAPSTLLQVDQAALNAFARATGGKQRVNGVRWVEKPTLASTARA